MLSWLCSRSHGQPSGPRRRATSATRSAKRSPTSDSTSSFFWVMASIIRTGSRPCERGRRPLSTKPEKNGYTSTLVSADVMRGDFQLEQHRSSGLVEVLDRVLDKGLLVA